MLTLYFISLFLPITPSPEQGRSQITRSNPSTKSGLYKEASFTMALILSVPIRLILSSISSVLLSEMSQEIISSTSSIPANNRLFPPGAAQRSSTLAPLGRPTIFPINCELSS